MKRAIISVSDKTGIIEFARELIKLDYVIYSTGGTLALFEKNNVKVKSIKSLTKFPEILNGRVKTLHPHIHGGILADKANKEHCDTCEEHGIKLIDLVVVNLYPFEETISKPKTTFSEAIEQIDIGGPTLIRAAAKNFQSVGVITDKLDFTWVLEELKTGELNQQSKIKLATKAFKRIAEYDISIANFYERNLMGDQKTKEESELPFFLNLSFEKVTDLRYGENPHQMAALYKKQEGHLSSIKQLHGKQLSYNNYLDIDSAISIVKDFELPGSVIIKHTNPCGAAIGDDLVTAYVKAHKADETSAFGSIVGLNRIVDEQTARELEKTFIEVIVAPGFDDTALKILTKKTNLRLIEANIQPHKSISYSVNDLTSATLVQTRDLKKISHKSFDCVTKTKPTSNQNNDLEFAFSLVKHVKSNAILLVKDGATIGIGAGQMSRIDAVDIAIKKAGESVKGAILASDAFFPFKDSVEKCAENGVVSIVQPGGSKRDQESIEACDKHNISMVFTGSRHFRH